MQVTLRYILIFFIVISIYYGLWQFVWLRLTRKYYNILKQDGESYFDFLCRWSTSPVWKLKKRLGFARFYRWRVFGTLVKIKGVLYILFGLFLWLVMVLYSRTDNGVWLDIVF